MSFVEEFRQPDRKYSANSFWFWNDVLEPEKLRHQIKEMSDKGVYNAFMHARAYLKTPYLEEAWWKAVDACVEEAKKNNFHLWLYDEYAWPSGTAGSIFEYGYQKSSRVLAQSKDFISKSIYYVRCDVGSPQELSERIYMEGNELVGMYIMSDRYFKLICDVNEVEEPSQIMLFFIRYNDGLVDYLNKDAIDFFIHTTYEEYRKRYGEYFGTLIQGVFFDEIYMPSLPFPWTESLPNTFIKKYDYDIREFLPALVIENTDNVDKIRCDYYELLSIMYENAYFAQVGDWCTKNNLLLTGHTEENLGGHPARQGSYFDTMKHLHIPGADNHDYRYRFPRKITYCEPKCAVSVSRVNGYERAMSEAMGGAGWGCSLQQFKRGINTMAAMGINMFILHGFYYSCEHSGSQGDWPTSFFYQNPYWKHFKIFGDYISRVCYMNTIGTPKVDVGLFYPVEEMRKNTISYYQNEEGKTLEKGYHDILQILIENQIDVDFVDKRSIIDASVENGKLCVGKEAFSVLIFPDTLIVNEELDVKLSQFISSGGKVLFYKVCGDRVFNGTLKEYKSLTSKQIYNQIRENHELSIIVTSGSHTDFYTNHRVIEGKNVFFLSNSTPETREYTILLKAVGKVSKLNPEDGSEIAIPYSVVEDYTEIKLQFQEDEAMYIVIGSECELQEEQFSQREQYAVSGTWEFLPVEKCEKDQNVEYVKSSELSIPVVTFASELQQKGKRVRIKNTDWEEGRCGRHLSLWNANVITRRASWTDDSSKKDLYFRKIVNITEKVLDAFLCIAAVNEYTLYINGELVRKDVSNMVPETIDVTPYLKVGENLVAVHVHNEKPGDVQYLSIDYLPHDRMISLLMEGNIKTQNGCIKLVSDESFLVCDTLWEEWNQLETNYENIAEKINYAASEHSYRLNQDGKWVYAWSRGELPLHPWGDLPLDGQKCTFPIQIAYTITLPAGTKAIYKPCVWGECTYQLDSMPIHWENELYELVPDRYSHVLSIQMEVKNSEEGLKQPIRVIMVPFETSLCDWRLHGLDWFSGDGIYRISKSFIKKSGRYVLNLGKVAFCTSVYINGQRVGSKVWAPYTFDITDYLVNGRNEIVVCVSNSAAVERQFMLVDEGRALGWDVYWNYDNIHREGENLTSGLLGPVLIERFSTDIEV